MFYFQTEQKVYSIGNWKIGGQPGENSTVLFGGVRKITKADEEELKKYLKIQKQLSEETGNPASVDLFIRKREHVANRIGFIANQISEPFLLDLPWGGLELKQAVLEYVAENKLQDRIIYNSINPVTNEEEVELLKKYGIKSAILLASDITCPNTDGSLSILEKKLIPYAEKAGIKNMLVDPGTRAFDDDNSAGEVLRSIMTIKSETGLPTGCAMINLVESWDYFKDIKDKNGYAESIAAANSVAQLMGANFLIYGPLNLAEKLFPSVKMLDKISKEANRGYFGLDSNIR
jgi:tetrahydromethanopterin S-methyltransferase subunit H